jgi:hypothetical protein
MSPFTYWFSGPGKIANSRSRVSSFCDKDFMHLENSGNLTGPQSDETHHRHFLSIIIDSY